MRSRHALVLSTLLLGACASTSAEKTLAQEKSEAGAPEHPIADIVEKTRKPEPIGKLLADLDQQILAWNNLFLAAQNETDRAKARNLEKAIMSSAHNRRGEIIEQLETGPLNNRIVAAAALGFTRDVEAQSPLLAALDDTNPQIVSSALLGLWLLGRADTPLDRIAHLLVEGDTEDIRTNAALCISTLVRVGARGESVLPALRMALLDRSVTVRSHTCLALAELGDSESFQAIADMLQEDTMLTSAASARAVAHLGAKDGRLRGKAARALVTAWTKSSEPSKSALFRAMVSLSETNYGSKEEDWVRWATRLP